MVNPRRRSEARDALGPMPFPGPTPALVPAKSGSSRASASCALRVTSQSRGAGLCAHRGLREATSCFSRRAFALRLKFWLDMLIHGRGIERPGMYDALGYCDPAVRSSANQPSSSRPPMSEPMLDVFVSTDGEVRAGREESTAVASRAQPFRRPTKP